MRTTILFLGLCLCTLAIHAQNTNSLSSQQVEKFLGASSATAKKVDEVLTRKTIKMLKRVKQEEIQLRKKLEAIDSNAASSLFQHSSVRYDEWIASISNSDSNNLKLKPGNYLPFLDSLSTSMSFLDKDPDALRLKSSIVGAKLQQAIANVNGVKGKFDKTADIRQFLRERMQQLKDQLSKYGLAKYIKKFEKQSYYYSQLVRDYKEIFSNPKKMQKHALTMLNKIPAFKKYMAKHSMMSSIFGFAGNDYSDFSFTGLQTRNSVQQAVQVSSLGSGTNPGQFLQQQMEVADRQLSEIKSKVAFTDLSGNHEQMPSFKPNQQKTKPFLKRVELGANVQFGKSNALLPTSGDFAISIGYKLNDKSVIGVGSSYKLGIGSFSRIQFTNQGAGLRSFIEWKLKGNLYLTGGYEKNYLPALAGPNMPAMLEQWQQSGVIGLNKKIPVIKNRKITLTLLFDFLSYQNVPRTQPVLFRTGWIFK